MDQPTAEQALQLEPLVGERFAATFSDDGNTITGRWEIAEDGTNYATDFDRIFRRVL